EFDLIRRLELREVGPEVSVFHPAARALEIHDENGPWVHRRNVERAACLDQHRVPAIGQRGDEPMDLALRQRLTAGDLDQPALVALDFSEDALEAALGAAVKGVGGVAPRAAQRAACEPDENAGTPRVGGFALDAEEDFGDTHGADRAQSQWRMGQPRRHAIRVMPRIGLTTRGCPTVSSAGRSPGLSPYMKLAPRSRSSSEACRSANNRLPSR